MAVAQRIAIVYVTLALLSGSAVAEKHALLIGIGDYPRPIVRLDGPAHDVDALRSRLIEQWGFQAANVVTLVDAEATRSAILDELDRLAARTRSGDYVVVYYSGHGTSAFDEDLRFEGADLSKWTGALIPHDYTLGPTPGPDPAEWTKRLIIGRRDLRPHLTRLDRDRHVFVIFDTCFSGNSVRSISKRSVRWVAPMAPVRSRRGISHLEDPFDDDAMFGAATAREEDYPYRRLIYLSAARKYERAEDISSWETIDQRPHGAMTHALLKGLDGGADADRDQRLTYDELYRFVHDEVSERHQHMPQLLYPEAKPELIQRPIFEHGRRTFAAAPVAAGDELRVKVGDDLRRLRHRIEALPRVTVDVAGRHDASIERQGDGLVALRHSSGDLIAGGFDDRAPERLLERIARLAQVQALIDLTYPRQHFQLSLELSDRSGFLTPGQRFDISARVDRAAVLVLLNVDKTGTVSMLYPIHGREMGPDLGLRETFEVVPPYGTEYLKLFAFRRLPAGLERWMNRRIDALDPDLDHLIALLRNPGVDSAQMRLKVVTVGELVREL